MKDNMLRILVLLLIFASLLPSSLANNTLANTGHYSLYLDEEGDAIVVSKLTFQNTGDLPQDSIIIEIPGKVDIVNLVQEVKIRIKNDNYYRGYYENIEFRPLEADINKLSESSLVTITLDKELSSQEIGTILLYYKIPKLASKGMGKYSFDFTTIKTAYDTHYVRVGAQAINGLHMDNIESDVNYQEEITLAVTKELSVVTAEDVNAEFTEISRMVGFDGAFVREAYGLDPHESLTVSSTYAKSKFMLHFSRNITLICAAVMLLGTLSFAMVRNIQTIQKNKKSKTHGKIGIAALTGLLGAGFVTAGIFTKKNLAVWVGWQFANILQPLMSLAIGFIVLICIFTPAVYFAMQNKSWKWGIICAIISGVILLTATIISTIIVIML